MESFAGLIFVNLDPKATPLADQTGDFLADLRRSCPRIDDLVRAHRYEVDIAANWKTVIDNNHECYHCAVSHKALMELVDYKGTAVWTDSGCTFTHRVEPNELDNTAYDLSQTQLEQEAMFGFVWPNTIPLMFPGSPSLTIFQVIPTGPETTRERWDFLFLEPTPADHEREFIRFIENTPVPEDRQLCENVQRGLRSLGYNQGRFVVDRNDPSYSEHHVHFFQKMVHDALIHRS